MSHHGTLTDETSRYRKRSKISLDRSVGGLPRQRYRGGRSYVGQNLGHVPSHIPHVYDPVSSQYHSEGSPYDPDPYRDGAELTGSQPKLGTPPLRSQPPSSPPAAPTYDELTRTGQVVARAIQDRFAELAAAGLAEPAYGGPLRRHVADDSGTGGGGMPYLVTSQRYLLPLFPALVAW